MSAIAKRDALVPRILPRVLYVIAVLALVDSLLGFLPGTPILDFVFTWIIPLPLIDWFSGLLTLILALGLERRKRIAWIAMMIFTALSLVLYGLSLVAFIIDPEEAWLTCALALNVCFLVAVLALLIANRRFYRVRSQPGNIRRALVFFLGAFFGLAAAALLTVLILLGREHFDQVFNPHAWPDWLLSLLGFGWALSFVIALWLMLRSQRESARMSVDEEARIRTLLAKFPSDSLGYFATRRDKSVLLTQNGAIAYRVCMGVALASGDPLGDPSTWRATVRAFVQHAADYGWTPAVIGASEAGARAWVDEEFHALNIGDEAILYPALFQLESLPDVRRVVRHISELGYTVQIRRHRSIPSGELQALASLADHWLDGEPERGFSMALGRLGDTSDGECVMVEALFPTGDQRGKVAALLSFAPWGADGLSLDVMRRHPQADNGVTELMVASLMREGREFGIGRVSLNFAMFRSALTDGARIGAGPILRKWRRLLLVASRWWQIDSLYRSNAKYNPQWSPRLICYPDGNDLLRVSLAMGVAEGFISLPDRFIGEPSTQPRRNPQQSAQLQAITAGTVGDAPTSSPRRPAQIASRLASREAMLSTGLDPYPPSVAVSATCAQADGRCTVAGRVMAVRDHGGVLFADLRDRTGDLQALLDVSTTGDDVAQFRRFVRAGDQVAVTGVIGASRTGTRSLLAETWQMTSKALRSLPNKHQGIRDAQTRVRQRHLALIVSPKDRSMVVTRSTAIQAIRHELLAREYLEVETPILQTVHGGANARPFITHINAYDLDLYLRIAPELYLKRLMVGGMERVFEIGRNFRNEGADATHNPEFTMLEAYQAHADYNVMKEVARDLVISAAQAALGTTVIRGKVAGVTHEIDLAAPWHTVSVCDAVSAALGEPVGTDTPVEVLSAHAGSLGIPNTSGMNWGAVMQELYEHLAESTTVGPTFFTDFPADTSPLTRPHREDNRLAERWDLIIFGSEVGTAYSELVDPVIQRQRLTAQSLAAAGGDPEAMELDEDFLAALEQGMPPSGGLGMGLDRLVMTLTGASIRETLTFPLVRPNR